MTSNPIDESTFTAPLIKALQQHVDAIAAGIVGLAKGRTSSEDDDTARSVAAPWVYLTVLTAWAEDHGLIDPWLRKAAVPRRDQFLAVSSAGAPGYLAHAVHALGSAHPSTWALLDPRYTRMRDGRLPEGPARALLDWWADEAPSLAWPDPEVGPTSLSGWLPGDLLQHLSADRRKRNALVQTPWWVCDFINDKTLRPAAREFAGVRVLRAIDPCCGTGHFLIRMVDLLWALYTTGDMPAYLPRQASITGWTPVSPDEAARRILSGLRGVELDPLTAAVARLRVTVAVAAKLARGRGLRLDMIPHSIRPRIVVGDSLLLGKMPRAEYAALHPVLAGIYESERELFGTVQWEDETPEVPVVPHAVIRPREAYGEQLDLLAVEAPVPP